MRKVITHGEFRAKLKEYLGFIEGGGVLCVGKREPVELSLHIPSLDKYRENRVLGGIVVDDKIKEIVQIEEIYIKNPCRYCGGESDLKGWEDGDEVYVHEVCVRQAKGKLAANILKGMQKIT